MTGAGLPSGSQVAGTTRSVVRRVATNYDIVCFSHLRWGFVHQRPQHLLSRCGRRHRVFFIEEPVYDAGPPRMVSDDVADGVTAVVPHLPEGTAPDDIEQIQRDLVHELLVDRTIRRYVLWFYTPMAVPLARELRPLATVYDCMDELSAFAGAPRLMRDREGELLDSADLVFTGGRSLFEAKKNRHSRVHLFPSSVDLPHFAAARAVDSDPSDQAMIPRPRLGFFGVIDERMDLDLVWRVSQARPDWHLVMIGPVVKIDVTTLPIAPNIHYFGMKSYQDLPSYLAGWDVAMMPFARNESTRFISPTKTPEYLAAGKPVVSTSIKDVVAPYGELGFVEIADDPESFVAACEREMARDRTALIPQIDAFLAKSSWDTTWEAMQRFIDETIARRKKKQESPVVDLTASTMPDRPGSSRGSNGPLASVTPAGFDYLVVGAGFGGSVLAERLARGAGHRVLVVEKRNHIGGNAYDHYDDHGILVHRYGPHVFHTNAKHVFDYLSSFTEWRPYQHRVLASVDGQLVPIPINLDTINTLYGLNLSSTELQAWFDGVREPVEHPRTSEDVVVSAVGRELYLKFFRNYTRKQWGMDPSELDASVAARVPTRTNRDDRYFTDTYQAMPVHGYTRMFERMLDHPNIKVMLNTDYREVVDLIPFAQMIYTGPIDGFFGFRYGELPYRSLEFRFETKDVPVFQQAPVINHPNDNAYTRVTEFKYLTGQEHPKTSLVYEYPRPEGDPYYPVPRPENADLYKRYRALAQRAPSVHFVGRLATYKYYNMDQVVAQALAVFDRLEGRRSEEEGSDDGLHGAILASPGGMGGDRVHPEQGGGPLVRPA